MQGVGAAHRAAHRRRVLLGARRRARGVRAVAEAIVPRRSPRVKRRRLRRSRPAARGPGLLLLRVRGVVVHTARVTEIQGSAHGRASQHQAASTMTRALTMRTAPPLSSLLFFDDLLSHLDTSQKMTHQNTHTKRHDSSTHTKITPPTPKHTHSHNSYSSPHARGSRSTARHAASGVPAAGSFRQPHAASGGDDTSTRSTLSGDRPNLTPRS